MNYSAMLDKYQIYHVAHQERFGQCQNFVLRQISIFVLVVQVKEPFYVVHQIVKHHAIQSRN